MALTVGELVDFIALDVDGRLRGYCKRLHERRAWISESADRASGRLKLLARAVAGLGVGLPAVAGARCCRLDRSRCAGGGAVKAFSMAAGPQLDAVTSSYYLYVAGQEASAEVGAQAAAAQEAYANSLAAMPPATRETAKHRIRTSASAEHLLALPAARRPPAGPDVIRPELPASGTPDGPGRRR